MNHDDDKPSSEQPTDERRLYVRPAVVAREPLEAVATTCEPIGLAKGTPAACPFGPISS